MSAATPNLKVEPRPEVAPAPVAPKKKGRAKVIGAAVAAVLLLASGGYWLATRGQETTDNAQIEAEVVPLATRVSGPVLRVVVKDNTVVKKGDLLLEIDPTEFEVKVRQGEAELATARANLAAAEAQATVATAGAKGGFTTARAQLSASNSGISNAEAMIGTAKAAVQRADAEARRTRLELERAKKLRTEDAISQAALDNAQASADSAQAALEQARAQLTSAEEGKHTAESRLTEARARVDESGTVDSKIAVAEASVQLAHARVDAAQAALDQAKLLLGYTQVRAPADGEVSKLTTREGQLLAAGQPIGQLVPESTYVVANFKETQIGHMREGQPVEVEVDALPGVTLHGRVESLAGATGARFSLLPPDNASGNFVKVVQRVPVRIAWADLPKDLHLRAGLSADVTVHTR